jgi:hypothetical protein
MQLFRVLREEGQQPNRFGKEKKEKSRGKKGLPFCALMMRNCLSARVKTEEKHKCLQLVQFFLHYNLQSG